MRELSDDHDLVLDKMTRCKWCGTEESKKWITGTLSGMYCSRRCEAADESLNNCVGTLLFSALLLAMTVSGSTLGFLLVLVFPVSLCFVLSLYGRYAMLIVPKNSRRASTGVPADEHAAPRPTPAIKAAAEVARLLTGTEWIPVPIEMTRFGAVTADLARVETSFQVYSETFDAFSRRAAFLVTSMNLHTALNERKVSEGQSKQHLVGWGSSPDGDVHLGLSILVTGVTSGRRCLCRVSAFSETEDTARSIVEYVQIALESSVEVSPPVHHLARAAPKVPRSSPRPKTAVEPALAPPAAHEAQAPQKVAQRVTIVVLPEQNEDCLRLAARVTNESEQRISNVDAFLISYPSASLTLTTDDSMCTPEVAAGSHQVAMFVLEPTREFAHGEIIAGVAYVDAGGVSHTVAADPVPVPVLKGMLRPEPMTKDDFANRWTDMETGEMRIKVEEWTPEELHEKALAVLRGLGFSEIESHIETSESLAMGEVSGSARGKYTGKLLLVTAVAHGISRRLDCSCNLTIASEDESLILPAMAVVKELLEAWLCPYCSARLIPEEIQKLKSGRGASCTSCGKALDIKSFWKDRY